MAGEIVERVARLLWKEFATEGTYDEDRHGDRVAYLASARAVLAAMRDPTEAMKESGRMAPWVVTETRDEDREGETEVWQAMIDEALKE